MLPRRAAAKVDRDKAYDSTALDKQMGEDYGIEMIGPNRRNRKRRT
jgi:hypothetical protein